MLFGVTFIVETSIDLPLSTSDKSFVGNDEQCLEYPQRGNTPKLSTSPKKIKKYCMSNLSYHMQSQIVLKG